MSLVTDQEKIALAKEATRHALNAICEDPRKYWLISPMTGTWDKLMAAHLELWDVSEEKREEVSESFHPRERQYNEYVAKKEAEEELLEYCREHGLTLEYLRENCIEAKATA